MRGYETLLTSIRYNYDYGKKIKIWLIGIIVIGVVLIAGSWIWGNQKNIQKTYSYISGNCDELRGQIHSLIESANYCDMDSDCVISAEFWCPFGCYNLFNKNANLTAIRNGVEKYNENCPLCLYKCSIPPTQEEIICKNNKCIDSRYEK